MYDRTHRREIRDYLLRQTDTPEAPFLQFVAAEVFGERIAEDDLDRFRPVVQQALNDAIGEGVARALAPEEEASRQPGGAAVAGGPSNERGREGVFEKDLVQRALEDF